jgi:hypothetical protein
MRGRDPATSDLEFEVVAKGGCVSIKGEIASWHQAKDVGRVVRAVPGITEGHIDQLAVVARILKLSFALLRPAAAPIPPIILENPQNVGSKTSAPWPDSCDWFPSAGRAGLRRLTFCVVPGVADGRTRRSDIHGDARR